MDPTIPPVVLQQVFPHFINPQELARRTVFRWYRIKNEGIDDFALGARIPGWGGFPGRRLADLWQILPIEDEQVLGYYDEQEIFHPFTAVVWGEFWGQDQAYLNEDDTSYYDKPFSVNKELGIFEFADPLGVVRTRGATGGVYEATLYCRLAVSVKDETTRAYERFFRVFDFAGPKYGTRPGVIRRDDLQLNVATVWDEDHEVDRLVTTEAEMTAECDNSLIAAALAYQGVAAQDRTYMGFVPISPDGAVEQVTWSCGPEGATTRASRGTEWNPAIPPFKERFQASRLAAVAAFTPELLSKVRRPPKGVR